MIISETDALKISNTFAVFLWRPLTLLKHKIDATSILTNIGLLNSQELFLETRKSPFYLRFWNFAVAEIFLSCIGFTFFFTLMIFEIFSLFKTYASIFWTWAMWQEFSVILNTTDVLTMSSAWSLNQKQPSWGVLRKRCSENMQQIYRRTPMSTYNFNKVAWLCNFIKIALRHGCFLKSHFGMDVLL